MILRERVNVGDYITYVTFLRTHGLRLARSDSVGKLRPAMRDVKSLSSLIARFLAEGESSGRLKPKSIRDYSARLREFDAFTGHTDLDSAVTMQNAKAWQKEKRAGGPSAEIVATMYLKSFASWLCDSEYRCGPEEKSVLVHLRAPKAKKRVRYPYTEQQLDAIWAALSSGPGPHFSTALLRILLATGILKQQARVLLKKDFHVDARGRGGQITIREQPHTDVGARKLRLDPETVTAVKTYLTVRPTYNRKKGGGLEPLLLSRNGLAYSEWGFSTVTDRIKERIQEETGIPWTAEDMRFTSNYERTALLRDQELRDKCTSTLESTDGDANLEDAVMAACKILEIRVRDAANPPPDQQSGVALMEFAFGDPTPALRFIAMEPREQKAVARTYAGLMGLYRNRAIHELRRDLDQRAARQIVSWIDHLLVLLDEAAPQTSADATATTDA